MAFCPSSELTHSMKALHQIGLHVRMPDRVDQHDAVLVEQPSVALTSWDLRRQTARQQPP
jgi:hypothetical protein